MSSCPGPELTALQDDKTNLRPPPPLSPPAPLQLHGSLPWGDFKPLCPGHAPAHSSQTSGAGTPALTWFKFAVGSSVWPHPRATARNASSFRPGHRDSLCRSQPHRTSPAGESLWLPPMTLALARAVPRAAGGGRVGGGREERKTTFTGNLPPPRAPPGGEEAGGGRARGTRRRGVGNSPSPAAPPRWGHLSLKVRGPFSSGGRCSLGGLPHARGGCWDPQGEAQFTLCLSHHLHLT